MSKSSPTSSWCCEEKNCEKYLLTFLLKFSVGILIPNFGTPLTSQSLILLFEYIQFLHF